MIKFILHGGGDIKPRQADTIIQEITNCHIYAEAKNTLIVPFARTTADYEEVFQKYQNRYYELHCTKPFTLASDDQLVFEQQLKQHHILFFTGGDERRLISKLINTDLKKLDHKIIIGVSAGANIFSSMYYSNHRSQVEEGYFHLPLKTICHFNQSNEDSIVALLNAQAAIQTILLPIPEGTFKTFYSQPI